MLTLYIYGQTDERIVIPDPAYKVVMGIIEVCLLTENLTKDQ